MNGMDSLPSKYLALSFQFSPTSSSSLERRFATFKIFYTEETPADYEPPHFQPGDANADRWFFTTHGADEAPDRRRVGGINTGHHALVHRVQGRFCLTRLKT